LHAPAEEEPFVDDAIGGRDAENQVHLDEMLIRLDGTENKGRRGANAVLACRWPSQKLRRRLRTCRSIAVSAGLMRDSRRCR
jgi:hypothetical protein